MKNGGSLGRRTLIKNLHVDHGTFKHVTLTVHMCDMILEEPYLTENMYTDSKMQLNGCRRVFSTCFPRAFRVLPACFPRAREPHAKSKYVLRQRGKVKNFV